MVASLFYLQDCYSNRSEISQLVTRECWDVFSIFSLQPGTVKVARKLCVAESRCFLFLCNLSSCLTRIKNGNITGCLTIVFFNQPAPPPHPTHAPNSIIKKVDAMKGWRCICNCLFHDWRWPQYGTPWGFGHRFLTSSTTQTGITSRTSSIKQPRASFLCK